MQAYNNMNHSKLFMAAITPEEGFMAAFEDKNGSPAWIWAKGECRSMHNIVLLLDRTQAYTFEDILSSNVAQQDRQEIFGKLATHTDLPSLQQSSLTFGPGGSFFARVKYITYHNFIPSSLKSQINSKKRMAEETDSNRVFPLQVALGVGGAWVALWSDKSFSWDLGNQYDDLHKMLNAITEDRDKPAFVALSPFKADDYFMVDRAGFIAYSVSNLSDKASTCLSNMTNGYMQLRAWKDGITYQNRRTVKNVTKSYVIGPETKFPTEISEMMEDRKFGSIFRESLMQNVFKPNGAEMWKRVQLANMRRRDLIPIATAGIMTATACNYAGLPKRMTVSATVGAVVGTGTCYWFLNMFSNKE
jgi:hypothetical protein